MRVLINYGGSLLAMLVLDACWLSFAALPMYRVALGEHLLTFRPVPGIIFYVLYAAGITVFAIPRSGQGSIQDTLVNGGLFGLFCYATYDLTNFATLKPWTFYLAATDIVWGIVLTAVSAVVGMLAGRVLF